MHNDIEKLKYLKLLSARYKNINEAATEIINLSAILDLPKATEHFVSDIHGEDESFGHVIRNASGVIKNYINELFGNTLMAHEKRNLATLIYYPAEKLEFVSKKGEITDEWYKVQLFRLLKICKRTSSKYTRSLVRKSLPAEFAYILEELIHEDTSTLHKQGYYNEIIDNIIRLKRARAFIKAISGVIQSLAIGHLHVLGDIYDRGKGAAKVMDILQDYHSVDVQWGNHDISWMGAASGSDALICNVIRISAKYDQLETIEEDYGINLVPLATFAMECYEDDDCKLFLPAKKEGKSDKELDIVAKMHKAITIMQFKAEADLIMRHPEYNMADRILLNKIDFNQGTISINKENYPLSDCHFPTIDPQNPLSFTDDEQEVMDKIRYSFLNSEKLQQHTKFLFNRGSMYKVYNSNLLFHGCIPLEKGGQLKPVDMFGCKLYGKAYLDRMEVEARKGYFAQKDTIERQAGLDIMWYLWCGADSPLYGKKRMTTFERYFIKSGPDNIYEEEKNSYYELRNGENICQMILSEFGLNQNTARIINGHTPVKVSKGENPVKADGRLLVIDGGFAKSYQAVTGIAGYTLIYNSQGLFLASHTPFVSARDAIENEVDILSDTFYLEKSHQRKKVADTDVGKNIREQIYDLELLLEAYRLGEIKER
ncbi:MAG: fructose-1,6-bisphosphatase [Defluviitaleaceae bacterium]|nr:fructose-1,6-bisphosphatase [Defluviitaleaceae bacterium]